MLLHLNPFIARKLPRFLQYSIVDPDLADEYVREKLGVMHPDEIAIPLEPDAKP